VKKSSVRVMSYQSSSSSSVRQQNQKPQTDTLVLSDQESLLLDDIEAATKRIYNQVSFAVIITVKLKARYLPHRVNCSQNGFTVTVETLALSCHLLSYLCASVLSCVWPHTTVETPAYPLLSYPLLSCLLLSFPLLSPPLLSCLVLSCPLLSCLVLSSLVLSSLVSSTPLLSCLVLSLSSLVLSYFCVSVLSCV
jgi:hypothetical protein